VGPNLMRLILEKLATRVVHAAGFFGTLPTRRARLQQPMGTSPSDARQTDCLKVKNRAKHEQ